MDSPHAAGSAAGGAQGDRVAFSHIHVIHTSEVNHDPTRFFFDPTVLGRGGDPWDGSGGDVVDRAQVAPHGGSRQRSEARSDRGGVDTDG